MNTKVRKLFTLALDSAAADGEWRNAAVMAVGALRKSGATLDILLAPSSSSGSKRVVRAVKMPFGKFKGHRLGDIPDDYLEWLASLDDLQPALRRAVQEELTRRENDM